MARLIWIVWLLLAVAGAWLAFGGADDPANVSLVGGATDTDQPRDVGDSERASFGDAYADQSATDSDAPTSVDERREVEGAGATRPGPRLQIVEGPERRPVVGAEVLWIERRVALEKGVTVHHESELVERFGLRAKTDAEGCVALPAVQRQLLVAGRHGRLFGFRRVGRNHREREMLVLQADHTLSVFVHDGAGHGVADVTIGVFERQGRRDDRRMTLSSGADGRVTVPHVQFRAWRARPKPAHVTVALLVPLGEAVAKQFPGEAPPEETIELVLPPTGSVTVRVQAPDGTPFRNSGRVSLRVRGRDRDFSPLGRAFDTVRLHKRTGKALALFPVVGLDLDLVAVVVLDDDDFRWNTPAFRGPAQAGQHVEVAAPMPATIGLLVGTLRDAAGEAWGNAQPSFLISTRAGRLEGEQLPVDADGHFELPFSIDAPVPPFSLEVRDEGESGPVGAVLALPALRVGTRTDLGDIVLEEFAVLAHGKVVDDRGQPVEYARVDMQLLRDLGGTPPRQDWRVEPYCGVRTDERGEFTLHGEPPLARARLHVSARDHMTTLSPEFPPGARVDLRLQRNASFRGEILVPRWTPPRGIEVKLIATEPGKRGRDARLNIRGTRGRYRFGGVEPGIYDFQVRMRGFPDPVVQHFGLLVEPGDNPPDSRIAVIDLQSALFRYRLRAVTATGEILANPGSPLLAKISRPDGEVQFSAFNWRNGRVEIITGSPQLELVQLATGTRPKSAIVGYGDSDVVFDRLQPVEIELPGLRALCGVGRTVRVSTVLVSETGLPNSIQGLDQRNGNSRGYSRAQLSKSSGAWLGPTDLVRVPLMRDGTYQVIVRLREEGARGEESRTLGTIDVKLDAQRSQRHQIAVDAAAIRDAAQKLAARKRGS